MVGRGSDWLPAGILAIGLGLVELSAAQNPAPLRVPLDLAIPVDLAGYVGSDIEVSAEELAVVGATSHLMRTYRSASASAPAPFFTLYVGYYESQTQGRTIHSPRNCLPGSGWEALSYSAQPVETPAGPVIVARYLVQRGEQQALVFYWYQGRGRVESGEYPVKYQLLRDAALRGRTEEALVRVMVPIAGDPQLPLDIARQVTGLVVPALFEALPEV